jgi:hypothetical protein
MTLWPRKKLPARFAHIILPLVITFCMTCVVSGVSTIKNLGIHDPMFLSSWMDAWGASWIVAFPVLLILLPIIRKFVFTFIETP